MKIKFLLTAMATLALGALACGSSAVPSSSGGSGSSIGPYDANADPKADIAAALEKAKSTNKLVLLDFGANWCPDCLVLDELFKNTKVKPYLDEHFVLVNIDVGQWDRNLDISEKYGNPISGGIPAEVVLTAQGDIVATTKNGELASARTATPDEILGFLQQWVAAAS